MSKATERLMRGDKPPLPAYWQAYDDCPQCSAKAGQACRDKRFAGYSTVAELVWTRHDGRKALPGKMAHQAHTVMHESGWAWVCSCGRRSAGKYNSGAAWYRAELHETFWNAKDE